MRRLRPEVYSDTTDRIDFELDASLLAFHLDTITTRNQTHGFEIFCRKLCERAICPNLRPQTGPDGGGDSKADTETFPVAHEIAISYYIGEPNAGSERWAFAFSAQKTWTKKVRADVEGLIATGRTYDRIFFVTSRPARSKDAARIELELSNEFGVPVTILDRIWIVNEVIDKNRKDLAFHYLAVGREVETARLGPADYSRRQQLDELEDDLADPARYEGLERDRALDALLAAKLSRQLELPRIETDGRFVRAIRMADEAGGYHSRLEARYERGWTAYWWFDDFTALGTIYDEVAALAEHADHARNLEFLVNLTQCLINAVVHGHISEEDAKLGERVRTLRAALEPMAAESERPNHQLEARASLLILRLNEAMYFERPAILAEVWQGFSDVLDRAACLGEFDAQRVTKMIEVAERFAGDDPAYGALVDKVSDFVAAREGDVSGAMVLLRRAEKLELTHHFEMIRLLSKAATRLTKKEHVGALSDAMGLLAVAYRSAGLFWAARASCVFSAATMIIEAEEGSKLPLRFGMMMRLWAKLSLDLHHWPDFLFSMRMTYASTTSLGYAEEQKERFLEDAMEMQLAAGSQLINLPEDWLAAFARAPDMLDALQLIWPHSALLYRLGYEDVLREDGSIPESETDEGVVQLFSTLASQPAGSEGTSTGPILNDPAARQLFSTMVLGLEVEVELGGDEQSVLVAELVLGNLEGFFATAVEQRVIPHVESITITIEIDEEADAPSFEVDRLRMRARLTWPESISPVLFEQFDVTRPFWTQVAIELFFVTCVVDDAERMIRKLCDDELVLRRMDMISAAANSYHRVTGGYVGRLADFDEFVTREYPPRDDRPEIEKFDLVGLAARQASKTREELSKSKSTATSHRDLSVRSVINLHAWNQAKWRGAAFAGNGPDYPPTLAMMFTDREAARAIFEQWFERIGAYDEQDVLRISIIRHLPGHSELHYAVQISANPAEGEIEGGRKTSLSSRSIVIEPASHTNLANFLELYAKFGAYYLIPAIWADGMDRPDFQSDLPILKRQLVVVDAAEVGEHDLEIMALHQLDRE